MSLCIIHIKFCTSTFASVPIVWIYVVWQEIKIGSNYQAKVPEVRTKSSQLANSTSNSSNSSHSSSNARNSSGHHDNGSSHPLGELVWNPKETTEEKGKIVMYLLYANMYMIASNSITTCTLCRIVLSL